MAKVVFWIHRFDAAKTAQIMTKILRSKPYIKASVQDGLCILDCHDLGSDPSGHICEWLVDQKKFMGKYHYSSGRILSIEKKQDRLQIPCCRFGFFDLWLFPEEMPIFEYWKIRFENLRSGMPMHQADMDAHEKSGHHVELTNEQKRQLYDSYRRDLCDFFGKKVEEAEKILDPIFPDWKNMPKKVFTPRKMTEKQKKKAVEREIKIMLDLVGKLQFMSPKSRKKFLNDNFLEELRLKSILKAKGILWVLENIGEIPGYTDI